MGGGRGPSLAYYVPSLSAMQLFLPVRPEAAHTQAAGQVYRLSDAMAAKVCWVSWNTQQLTSVSLEHDKGPH